MATQLQRMVHDDIHDQAHRIESYMEHSGCPPLWGVRAVVHDKRVRLEGTVQASI